MIRLIGYFFGVGVMLALVAAAGVAIYLSSLTKDLPDYEVLEKEANQSYARRSEKNGGKKWHTALHRVPR